MREVSNGDYVHIDLLSVLGSQDAPQDKEVREALKKYNTCLLSKVVACTAGQHLVTRGNRLLLRLPIHRNSQRQNPAWHAHA